MEKTVQTPNKTTGRAVCHHLQQGGRGTPGTTREKGTNAGHVQRSGVLTTAQERRGIDYEGKGKEGILKSEETPVSERSKSY